MLKRAHDGISREVRSKHVAHYVWEFAGGQNLRDRDTINQMRAVARGTGDKSLRHEDSTVDDVLSLGTSARETTGATNCFVIIKALGSTQKSSESVNAGVGQRNGGI